MIGSLRSRIENDHLPYTRPEEINNEKKEKKKLDHGPAAHGPVFVYRILLCLESTFRITELEFTGYKDYPVQ